MGKRRKILCGFGLLLLTLMLLIFYNVVFHYVGPQINDTYAREQESILTSAALPKGICFEESTSFIGKAAGSDDFIVWVGIAVSTDYSSNDIQSIISSIPELKNAEIIPYSLELANQYRFSGIQKKIPGSQTDGYYLIGLSIKPKIIIDKRNQ